MKKVIMGLLVLALALTPVVFAANTRDEIRPNGMAQGTLVRVLYNHQAALNDIITNVLSADAVTELKADHDADNDAFEAAKVELTELKSDHDADNNLTVVYAANDNSILNAGVIQTYGALLGAPGLAKGGTATKVKTTNPISYTVNGTYFYKAATDDVCDPTGVTALTTDYVKILLSIGSAGTCTVTAGTPAVSQVAAEWPAIPSNEIVLGGLEIGDGGAHDFSSDAIDADGYALIQPKAITGAVTLATASAFAADLTAPNPSSFAADLTAEVATGTIEGDDSIGSGTPEDPIIRLD